MPQHVISFVLVPHASESCKCFNISKMAVSLVFSYAMDWEPSHGRIRVMLGKSGKIVCSLKVDPMYCTGQGNVQLLRVEGCSDETGIQNLQVHTHTD